MEGLGKDNGKAIKGGMMRDSSCFVCGERFHDAPALSSYLLTAQILREAASLRHGENLVPQPRLTLHYLPAIPPCLLLSNSFAPS